MKKWMTAFAVLAVLVYSLITWASPADGVTPTLLARGTYEPFKVRSAEVSPDLLPLDLDFKAEAKDPVDIVVRRHDYAPGGYTGWHTHPGPVFITVTQGSVTFYEADDPTCAPHLVTADPNDEFPATYVDTGRGHYGRNETGQTAQDMTVIIAPVGRPFRGERFAETGINPACGF